MALSAAKQKLLSRQMLQAYCHVNSLQKRAMSKLTLDNYPAKPNPAPWNYLWQPGPYPVTEEAMAAAAKKYGMIREDYKPIPPTRDDHRGDYPDLPRIGDEIKSGMYDWDIPQTKRNYNEPLHMDYFVLREGFEITTPPLEPEYKTALHFFRNLMLILGPIFIAEYMNWKSYQPLAKKQLLDDGPHYTFELE